MHFTFGTMSMEISTILIIFTVLFMIWAVKKFRNRDAEENDNSPISISFEGADKKASIAVIEVRGPILDDEKDVNAFVRQRASFGKQFDAVMKALSEKESIKGAIVKFTTPGGTVSGSQYITDGMEHFKKAEKPIYSYIDGVSASGGVMAMVAADKVLSHPQALTGSVGVIGPTIDHYAGVTSKTSSLTGGTVKADKIETEVLSVGTGKAFGNPYCNATDMEAGKAVYNQILERSYIDFLAHIQKARNILPKTLRDYGAHIMDVPTAINIGLVDEACSFEEAVESLAEKIGFTSSDEYRTFEITYKKRHRFEKLFALAPLPQGYVNAEINRNIQMRGMMYMSQHPF